MNSQGAHEMREGNEKSRMRLDYKNVPFETNQAQQVRGSVRVDQIMGSQVPVPEKRGLRKFFAYVGPGFLVAIAYMDPGNFESDLQAGAQFKYELLWVLLLATVAGTLIQSLASNLGVVTGKHLAEHCRAEYPAKANYALWFLAEVAIVASDIPEVIGTAYALNMLFNLQLWLGVLLTGFSTLLFLALQQYGVRKLEFFIFFLVFTIAGCFFIELHFAKPPLNEVLRGLFIPYLQGHGAFGIAISLMGAMVMPHNLYLHSALVLSRRTPRTIQGIKDGCRYNFIECSFALLLSFAINLAVVSVSGAVCSSEGLSSEELNSCSELDLNHASFLLRNVLGSWSSTLFGISLLASGQSSTITGTYAGQYVMQGFLELQFAPWIRNMVTRCVAIVPSLVVALIGGSRGAGKLIIASSMILSFELPFALLPLLKFTSSNVKMGPHVNSTKKGHLKCDYPLTKGKPKIGKASQSIKIEGFSLGMDHRYMHYPNQHVLSLQWVHPLDYHHHSTPSHCCNIWISWSFGFTCLCWFYLLFSFTNGHNRNIHTARDGREH